MILQKKNIANGNQSISFEFNEKKTLLLAKLLLMEKYYVND